MYVQRRSMNQRLPHVTGFTQRLRAVRANKMVRAKRVEPIRSHSWRQNRKVLSTSRRRQKSNDSDAIELLSSVVDKVTIQIVHNKTMGIAARLMRKDQINFGIISRFHGRLQRAEIILARHGAICRRGKGIAVAVR